ncbi:hypothetical protein J6T66_01280 [bacterium]|nr:hypothetical protein [bacterium]
MKKMKSYDIVLTIFQDEHQSNHDGNVKNDMNDKLLYINAPEKMLHDVPIVVIKKY